MSTIKLGPFAPDVADYNVGVSRAADNCVALINGFRSLPEEVEPENGSNGEMTGFDTNYFDTISAHRFYNRTEGEWMTLMAGEDSSGVHELWSSSSNHTTSVQFMQASISIGFGPIDRYPFVDWDDEVLIFGNMTPQKITHANIAAALNDSGTTKTSDLGGSPPASMYAAKVRSQVVTGYTYESSVEYPSRLWWSAFGDHEGWTSGTNQAGFEDAALANGGDITGIVGGEYGLVFQQEQITRLNYIGAPDIWQFDPIEEEHGCHAPASIVKAGRDVYYNSPSGFRVVRDGSGTEAIGASLIDEWFKDQGAGKGAFAEFERLLVGAYDAVSGCVFWAFRSIAQPGTYESEESDKVLIFNTRVPKERAWSTGTLRSMFLYTLEPQGDVGPSTSLCNFGLGIIQNVSDVPTDLHLIGQDSHSSKTAVIETGMIFTEGSKTFVNRGKANIDGAHTLALLTKADTAQDTEVDNGPETPDSYGYCYFDIEARYHRIELATTGDWEKAASIEIDQSAAGEY